MTVTVAPTAEPSDGPQNPPRIRLDVSDNGGLSSTTITRLDPDGRVHPVRTVDGLPLALSGGVGLAYDYEAPYGAEVSYSSIQSPGTVSEPVVLVEPSVWLVHPGIPELSMPAELSVESFADEEWAVTQGVHWVMGREHPVVQTDGQRKAPGSSLTVLVESLADLDRLRTILFDASPLLLNVPVGLGFGVATSYVAIGAVSNRRVSSIGGDPLRRVTLPYQVVDRPVGGSQSTRNYADVLVDNATYADVRSSYSSYFALLAGP